MSTPTDLSHEALGRFAAQNIPGLLFVTVGGAHLYGLPSPVGVDLRGAFAAPLREVLSLDKPTEVRESHIVLGGSRVALIGQEIEACLRHLGKASGAALELILSPLVVVTSPSHEELKGLARASLSRRVYHYYAALARRRWGEYGRPDVARTAERLLRLHRLLMTGIVLLTEGALEVDLARLNARFGLDLTPLLAARRRHLPQAVGSARPHEESVSRLLTQLDEAYASSPLPDDVPNRPALSDFLVRVRLAAS